MRCLASFVMGSLLTSRATNSAISGGVGSKPRSREGGRSLPLAAPTLVVRLFLVFRLVFFVRFCGIARPKSFLRVLVLPARWRTPRPRERYYTTAPERLELHSAR